MRARLPTCLCSLPKSSALMHRVSKKTWCFLQQLQKGGSQPKKCYSPTCALKAMLPQRGLQATAEAPVELLQLCLPFTVVPETRFGETARTAMPMLRIHSSESEKY